MHFATTSVLLLVSLFLIPSTLAKEQYSNSKMVCLVNKERQRYGLKPLSVNPALTKSAQSHSDYQARTKKMSHTGAGGSNPGQRAKQAGYQWNSVGENVAYGYPTMVGVMKVWMNSPGHRANILGKSYTCMGSAVAYAGSTPYFTQEFGAGGSTAGQNAPKCDGSDQDYGGSQGGGNDYGGEMGGNDYGGQGGNQGGNQYGGGQGGNQGGNQYGGSQGGNDYGNDYGGGNDSGNDYGNDYGNNGEMDSNDYGGRGGGGKKPCNKGGQKGGNQSEY